MTGSHPADPSPAGAGGVLRARARAKVNLRHRVFARDETGHHSVETLLLRTSLHDELELAEEREGEGGSVALELAGTASAGLPTGEKNLCVRAAEAFLGAAFPARRRPAVRLRLTKRIPVGSGLGGGSADAAAALRLLARRWPRLDSAALFDIAGGLGADVPFGLLDVPVALGWERGRRLLPLRPPPVRPGLLVCPGFEISTREAYGWLAERRSSGNSNSPGGGAFALPGAARLTSWETLSRLVRNDLEAPVFERQPALAELLVGLRSRAPIAGMTGSGSTLFAIFADEAERQAGRAALSAEGHDQGPARLIEIEVPV